LLRILGLLVAVPLAGILYQLIGSWRDRRRYPPPGCVFRGLHLFLSGEQGAPIILEAGVAATSLSWQRVQPEIARFARVASYDRAGLGWSARAATPRSLPNLVGELHRLLRDAEVPLPCVFVGHSFGGLLLRHYTAAYPDDVAGLVLVDPLVGIEWWPLSPLQRYRLSRGVILSRWGALLARLGIVRFALDLLLSGFRAIPKMIAKASSGRGASVTERLVGEVSKLPPEVWPAVRSHWCLPKSFSAMADYLEQIPIACAAPVDDTVLAGKPVVILSAATSRPEVIQAQAAIAALSSRGVHRVVEGSGHWIQLDRPEQVIAALMDCQAAAAGLTTA
jgi:pimeloyl-ACP methyl ester carboxylesterase